VTAIQSGTVAVRETATGASTEAPKSRSLAVWRLAWPAVLTSLLQSTVGVVDVQAVGSLGASAVAAATAGQRLLFILHALLSGVTTGTVALVARAWGANDRDEASRVVSSSLVIGCSIALMTTLIACVMAAPFATMFGLEGGARELAATYIRWVSCFTVVFAVSFVLSGGLRGAGDTRTPLLIGLVTNSANVFFLYLLVYGALRFPKLGIKGAALAWGLAFTVGALLVVYLWRSGRLLLRPLRGFAGGRERFRKLVLIGYPAALEQLVWQSGFIVFTVIISRFSGTAALAAYGIGVQIHLLSNVVGFGFAIAAATLVGQHLGAGEPEQAAQSARRAVALAVGSMSVVAVLIFTLARPIATLMISDPEVARLLVGFLHVIAIAQPLIAVEHALGGSLRGAGDTRFLLLTASTGWLGRLLFASVFAWLGYSVEWLFAALLADYILKAILLITRFRSNKWQQALARLRARKIGSAAD